MGIRVVGSTVNSTEISSDIAIEFPAGLSDAQKDRIKDEVGELLVETILLAVGSSRSPISGEDWPPLSNDYADFKQNEGRGSRANMELNGDMLDALEFVRTVEGIRLQITGDQAPKADGHNNFSGESSLPRRKFLPERGDTFKGEINNQVDAIISDEVVTAGRVTRARVREVQDQRQLNSLLRELFPVLTLRQAKDAVLFNDELRSIFAPVIRFF